LKNKILSPLTLTVYFTDLSETPKLSLTSLALPLVLVLLRSVNNEGHLKNKSLLHSISPSTCILWIFLNLHTCHSLHVL